MWPYLLLYTLALFCAFSDLLPIKNRWIACGTLLVVMAVMAIFRDNIGGYDFFMYSLYYKAAVPINDYLAGRFVPEYHSKDFECGFAFLCCLIKTFDWTKGPYLLFMVITSFNFVIFYKALKKYTPFVFIAILFYLYKGYIWHNFTLLRQSVSIALFMYSIQYIKDKKMLKYMGLNLIGFCFHESAIILFPLYFLLDKKYTTPTLIIFMLIALGCNIGNVLPVVCMKLAGLLGMEGRLGVYMGGHSSINPMNFLEILLILSISLYQRGKYDKEEPFFNIFLNMFVFSSLIILSCSAIDIFARFKEYFVVAYMVLISYMVGHLESKRSQFVAFGCLALYVLAGYVRYLLTFDQGGLLPYKWILF